MTAAANPYAGYSKRVAEALASFDRREQEKREAAKGLHWKAAA